MTKSNRCGVRTIVPTVGRSLSRLIGPRSLSEARVCHFWVCAHCGDEFETYSVLTASLTPKIVEAHLPTLLVA